MFSGGLLSYLKKRKISRNGHSLSLVVIRFITLCHSLSFVVTRCTTRLSFCKRSITDKDDHFIFQCYMRIFFREKKPWKIFLGFVTLKRRDIYLKVGVLRSVVPFKKNVHFWQIFMRMTLTFVCQVMCLFKMTCQNNLLRWKLMSAMRCLTNSFLII